MKEGENRGMKREVQMEKIFRFGPAKRNELLHGPET